MGPSVVETVETSSPSITAAVEIRLLGPISVRREGAEQALPASRKVRALLAFLVLNPQPVGRARLCDLLWDGPNDPRGELRWCLSKLRSVLGEDHVISTTRDLVALDLRGCVVDVLEADSALEAEVGLAEWPLERLVRISELFRGVLLEGLEVDACPEFNGWLAAHRHRYRTHHIAMLEELAKRAPSSETFVYLKDWLELAPLDTRPHIALLDALMQCGRLGDAEEHFAATIRSFEREGVDWLPLRDEWRSIREAATRAPTVKPSTLTSVSIPFKVAESRDASVLTTPAAQRRASVAIMPFVDRAATQSERGVGDGLTDDIITRLAKLRVLFVIARGTVYALNDRRIGPEEAGRILNVEYVASGSVRHAGQELAVRVELVETRNARIVWTDELSCVVDKAFHVSDHFVDRIVAAIAEEIELAECQRAVLKAPESLDAWQAYHRGLWHMYKFNAADNRDAEAFFRTAIGLDPTFARAHAGLSFTHFQNAFLDLTADREHQIEEAFATAALSLSTDDRDPAAHWAMGRALWLRGAQDESLAELQRSIDLSPNFALGHYTLGFVHSQSGDPQVAIDATSYSSELSPFDPLQFAMLASRAMAHARLGEVEKAAHWAVKATARPNAHTHILAIATECLALANRRDEARQFVARIRQQVPAYTVENFLRAFRFDPEMEKVFRRSASQIDFG